MPQHQFAVHVRPEYLPAQSSPMEDSYALRLHGHDLQHRLGAGPADRASLGKSRMPSAQTQVVDGLGVVGRQPRRSRARPFSTPAAPAADRHGHHERALLLRRRRRPPLRGGDPDLHAQRAARWRWPRLTGGRHDMARPVARGPAGRTRSRRRPGRAPSVADRPDRAAARPRSRRAGHAQAARRAARCRRGAPGWLARWQLWWRRLRQDLDLAAAAGRLRLRLAVGLHEPNSDTGSGASCCRARP